MESQYAVTLRGKHAGKVLVKRQGLYYSFHCRCELKDDAVYRLMVTCGQATQSLGVPVPKDESFMLDTQKPVKAIGEGDFQFTLVPKKEKNIGVFVPIYPEEPFAYISRLKQSFLILREGQPGICIEKMQEC